MSPLHLAAAQAAAQIVLNIPEPQAEQPPGTEGLGTLLNYLLWFVFVGGVAGFLGCVGILIFSAFTGREFVGVKGLVITLIGCALAGSASGIIQAVV